MTFLNPAILAAGLAAVAIPIIIHLLMRRRRTPVMWGAMRFVLEAYRQTRRRLLLERWLLLAVRCLLVAALGIALGRPILRSLAGGGEQRGRTVLIVIDDSLASAVVRSGGGGGSEGPGGGATALDHHIQSALKLLAALGPGDRAGVITMSRPAGAGILPASSDLQSVRAFVKDLKPTDARADLPAAMALAALQFADAGSGGAPEGPAGPGAALVPTTRFVALYSDWLAGSVEGDVGLPKVPPSARLAASLPGPGVDQFGLGALAPMRQVMVAGDAGGTQTVTVALQRSGPFVDRAFTAPVRITLAPTIPGGQSASAQGVASWARGERTTSLTLALAMDPSALAGPGVLSAEVRDANLSRDDAWSLPIDTRPLLRVGVIAERDAAALAPDSPALLSPAQWLALALRPGEQQPIQIVPLDSTALDPSRLAGLDAVWVLQPDRVDAQGWGRLGAYARAGGLVGVTPPARAGAHTWPDAMTEGLGLSWTLPREAKTLDPASPTGARGRILSAPPSDAQGERDVLAAVRGELPELTSSVQVVRVLAPQPLPGARDLGDATVLLALDDGSPLVVVDRPGATGGTGAAGAGNAGTPPGSAGAPPRGVVVYLSTALSLDWTDLPAKPLMVPLMQELVRQGLSRALPPLRAVAGEAPVLPAAAAELHAISGAERLQAGANIHPIKRRGLFRVLDRVGSVRGVLAVNPDPRGAQTDAVPLPAVETWLSTALPAGGERLVWLKDDRPPGSVADGAEAMPPAREPAELLAPRLDGAPTSSWWVLIALVLAVSEVFLARRVSHAALGGPSVGGMGVVGARAVGVSEASGAGARGGPDA